MIPFLSRDVATQRDRLSPEEARRFNNHWIEAHGLRPYVSPEFLARDVLMAELREAGLLSTPEFQMSSGRADIATWGVVHGIYAVVGLFEVKVANPLDGVGQLLAYQHATTWEFPPLLILAVPREIVTRRVVLVAGHAGIWIHRMGLPIDALAMDLLATEDRVPAPAEEAVA